MSKNIIIIGGDGFCGWPLALRLSNKNNNVLIIDNLSRRKIDLELGTSSLTEISSIQERLSIWKEVTGKTIKFLNINIATEYEKLKNTIQDFQTDVIVHLAEQRAAPYSMKSRDTSRYTVDNNLSGTHNVLSAIVDVNTNIHLVHIGTMGVYGYGAVKDSIIPEGYVDVKMDDGTGNFKDIKILHPFFPGSIYHMTKTQDALFFQFYKKNWNIRITDLHQGIIWGLYTEETKLHDKLINRFDYDGDYGTVLNRFIMQAANDIPLTVYGTGEQTRAFIHIENSMDCIEIAINNKAEDRVEIYNQMTETHTLNDIVELIKKTFDNVKVDYLDNPRKELKKNDLKVKNQQFLNLGLKPKLLTSDKLKEIYDYIKQRSKNIDISSIYPSSKW